ncbi:hypothetical protein E2C01_006136 [Portunus trituberculatus]|uniref:Uncharacterized protein n=1 Tax=Portunus trituberculatus TaxID=210409 RepID=A0A5B7D0Z7_PORTR|nr:hypothetical protein [Portunus trituberculatus]
MDEKHEKIFGTRKKGEKEDKKDKNNGVATVAWCGSCGPWLASSTGEPAGPVLTCNSAPFSRIATGPPPPGCTHSACHKCALTALEDTQ